jgi:hypothetical protein
LLFIFLFQVLLDLDSIHGFGENIDQYGRKELPFTIEKLPDSQRFSLIVDSSSEAVTSNLKWYQLKINKLIKLNEQKHKASNNTNDLNNENFPGAEDSGILDSHNQLNISINEDTSNLNGNKLNESLQSKSNGLSSSSSAYQQLNKDCLEYIQKNSPLIAQSLSFLFDEAKRDEFFKSLSEQNIENNNAQMLDSSNGVLNSALSRFIQLYVPLDFMKHHSVQIKLNLITQFLLTKTEDSKIELIIDLANYYARKQEWNLVLQLLNNCTQENEELNDFFSSSSSSCSNLYYDLNNEQYNNQLSDNLENFSSQNFSNIFLNAGSKESNTAAVFKNSSLISNCRFSQKDLYNLYDHACVCLAYQEWKESNSEKAHAYLFKMKNFIRQVRAIFGMMHLWHIDGCIELIEFCLARAKLYEQPFINNTNNNANQNTDMDFLNFQSGKSTKITNLCVFQKLIPLNCIYTINFISFYP